MDMNESNLTKFFKPVSLLKCMIHSWCKIKMELYYKYDHVIEKRLSYEVLIWNCRMGLSLHQHGHSHSGHSHGDNPNMENGLDDDLKGEHSKKNINVRAAFIHVLGDFIQSIGVFVAALVIYFKVQWIFINFLLIIHSFFSFFFSYKLERKFFLIYLLARSS